MKIESKRLEWFKTQKQVRIDPGTEDELRLLGESLRERQLQPILALACGLIIVGHRRYWAAKLVGLESLEVIILDAPLSDSARQAYQLVENLQRAGLSERDTYVGMAEWLCMNPGAELKDLAKALSLDPSTVTRYMSVSKLCPEALAAFNEGKLTISAAYAIAKRPASEQPGLLALRLSGASRDVLEQVSRQRRGGRKVPARASRIKCALPSGASVVVSAHGLTLDLFLEALVEAGRECRKARDQGLTAKEWQAVQQRRKVGAK
jgi:ParB/RepB/Spo0J family partition protein